MEMHPNMFHLAERLVTAIEGISEDVKNMSAYIYDISRSVSHVLNERKGKEGISAELFGEDETISSGPLAGGQEPSTVSKHSLLYEEADVRSLPLSDVLEQGEVVVDKATSTDTDYNENSDVLSALVEVNIKELYESEDEGELHGMDNTFNNSRNSVEESLHQKHFVVKEETVDSQKDSHDGLKNSVFPLSMDAQCREFAECDIKLETQQCLKQVPGTTSSIAGEEEAHDTYFLEGDQEEEVAGERQVQNCEPSEDGGFVSYEGMLPTPLKSTSKGRAGKKRKRNFKCSTCKKTFARKDLPVERLQVLSNEEQLQCRECGRAVSHGSTLVTVVHNHPGGHVQTHEVGGLFKCNQCEKSFKRRDALIAHSRSHTGERPFKCHQCGKGFKRNRELSAHLTTHTEGNPFKCNQCEKSFKTSCYLIKHMKTHGGGKSYQCSQCGKLFTDRSNCNVHMRTHSGEKPFKCSECGKSFPQKHHLTNHMRLHTRERPFVCSLCGKGCTTAGNLNSHMRHVHAAVLSAS